jgi:hypothetical protein
MVLEPEMVQLEEVKTLESWMSENAELEPKKLVLKMILFLEVFEGILGDS